MARKRNTRMSKQFDPWGLARWFYYFESLCKSNADKKVQSIQKSIQKGEDNYDRFIIPKLGELSSIPIRSADIAVCA